MAAQLLDGRPQASEELHARVRTPGGRHAHDALCRSGGVSGGRRAGAQPDRVARRPRSAGREVMASGGEGPGSHSPEVPLPGRWLRARGRRPTREAPAAASSRRDRPRRSPRPGSPAVSSTPPRPASTRPRPPGVNWSAMPTCPTNHPRHSAPQGTTGSTDRVAAARAAMSMRYIATVVPISRPPARGPGTAGPSWAAHARDVESGSTPIRRRSHGHGIRASTRRGPTSVVESTCCERAAAPPATTTATPTASSAPPTGTTSACRSQDHRDEPNQDHRAHRRRYRNVSRRPPPPARRDAPSPARTRSPNSPSHQPAGPRFSRDTGGTSQQRPPGHTAPRPHRK